MNITCIIHFCTCIIHFCTLSDVCVCVCAQGGSKAVDLAEQEENSKCASILQEYESHTPQTGYEDLPKFQYCKRFSLELKQWMARIMNVGVCLSPYKDVCIHNTMSSLDTPTFPIETRLSIIPICLILHRPPQS